MHSSKETLLKMLMTCGLFILIFGAMSFGIMQFYFGGENYYYQDSNERDALAGTIDTLVIGASHAQRGFDTRVIDEKWDCNSYNLGGPSFSVQGRYDLMKRELARNPVKTVVIEVSTGTARQGRDTVGYEGDLYYMGRMNHLSERVSYFFQAFKPSEYAETYSFFLSNGLDCLERLKDDKYRNDNNELRYKGYSPYLYEDYTDVTPKKGYKKLYNTSKVKSFEPIEENVEYLQKIVDLCKSYDCKVIMATVPVSLRLICKNSIYDDGLSWYRSFAKENDLEYLDFNLLKNRDQLFSDKYSFNADGLHLYNDSATLFTEQFCDIFSKVEAGEDVSDLFFESYDAYERTQDYYPE